MPRLFEELEAGPEPPLHEWYSSHMGETPICLECHTQVPVPGWHLNPDTGDYACDSI